MKSTINSNFDPIKILQGALKEVVNLVDEHKNKDKEKCGVEWWFDVENDLENKANKLLEAIKVLRCFS